MMTEPTTLRSPVVTHAAPAGYIQVPVALLRAYAHDPLAIGCYLAVARCALAARGAVPLSAADLAAWTGDARPAQRTRIWRCLSRLVTDGWLRQSASSAGVKGMLLPLWGQQHPWRWDVPGLGRPQRLATLRVATALLDAAIGRLNPHPRRIAAVERYLCTAALNLRDLGIYALRLAGFDTAPTPVLQALGLDGAGTPPPTLHALLMTIAAGGVALPGDASGAVVALNPCGRSLLGLPAVLPPPPAAHSHTRSPAGSAGGSASGSPHVASCCAASPLADTLRASMDHDGETNKLPLPPTRPYDLPRRAAPVDEEDVVPLDEAPPLHPEVRANHTALNAYRPVAGAEWAELCLLQQLHGAMQLLAWQGRALRVSGGRQRLHGVTPAYYTACATQEALSPPSSLNQPRAPRALRPRPVVPQAVPAATRGTRPTSPAMVAAAATGAAPAPVPPPIPAVLPPAAVPAPVVPPPAPAVSAVETRLQQLGVRHPGALRRLATVDPDLLTRWEQACAHPGMGHLARDVGALVASCLQQGSEPPPRPRLDAACPARPQGSGFDLAAFLATPAPAPAAPTYTAADLAAAVAASSFRPRRFTGWNEPAADPVSSPCLAERNAP